MATNAERLAILNRLERAAHHATEATTSPERFRARERMAEAWNEFPECHGEQCPTPESCLTIVRRIRDEIEADQFFEAQLKRSKE